MGKELRVSNDRGLSALGGLPVLKYFLFSLFFFLDETKARASSLSTMSILIFI